MYGMLKISMVVFSSSYQDRVNSRQVTLYTKKCSEKEARAFAKEWINMNEERFNTNYLDIVFSPDAIEIEIDELK